MDGATINAKIYAGRAKAALRLGLDCRVYRPLTAAAPMGNNVATLKASFNSGDNSYRNPNLPGDAIWYADLDGTQTRPGDYLVRVSDGQTYYIAAMQPLLPIVCVDCNASVQLSRQAAQSGVGTVGYGGMVDSASVAVLGTSGAPLTYWPASILMKGSGSYRGAGLPSGVRPGGWRMLLPPSVPVPIIAGDIATDDRGRRFTVDGAELTDLGWRLDVSEVHS